MTTGCVHCFVLQVRMFPRQQTEGLSQPLAVLPTIIQLIAISHVHVWARSLSDPSITYTATSGAVRFLSLSDLGIDASTPQGRRLQSASRRRLTQV